MSSGPISNNLRYLLKKNGYGSSHRKKRRLNQMMSVLIKMRFMSEDDFANLKWHYHLEETDHDTRKPE